MHLLPCLPWWRANVWTQEKIHSFKVYLCASAPVKSFLPSKSTFLYNSNIHYEVVIKMAKSARILNMIEQLINTSNSPLGMEASEWTWASHSLLALISVSLCNKSTEKQNTWLINFTSELNFTVRTLQSKWILQVGGTNKNKIYR